MREIFSSCFFCKYLSSFIDTSNGIYNPYIVTDSDIPVFADILGMSTRKREVIPMYPNKVEICGVNTSDLKVLGDEEKRELLKRARSGDEEARQKLILHNLRLVSHIVRKYYGTSPDHEDLTSIGTIGLIKAIDSFNIYVRLHICFAHLQVN